MEQVIGLTDFDFAPQHIAKQFIADDQRVMRGGSVTDRLETTLPVALVADLSKLQMGL